MQRTRTLSPDPKTLVQACATFVTLDGELVSVEVAMTQRTGDKESEIERAQQSLLNDKQTPREYNESSIET